jgi:hypothetical protein
MAVARSASAVGFDDVPLGDGIRTPIIDRQSEITFSAGVAIPSQFVSHER